MDAKLLFWTAAFANFACVAFFAARGIARVRRGDAVGHRRAMRVAIALVVLFVLAYAAKLGLLGREDRSDWSGASLAILYVHETCIAVMIVAGSAALTRVRRFGAPSKLRVAPADARTPDRRFHRAAGRTAVIATALALVTAGGVLAGMYLRALS